MKKILFLICAGICLLPLTASSGVCLSARNTATTAETGLDVAFYESLFPDSSGVYRGNDRWNKIILECNRQRDNKGKEVGKATAVHGDNEGKLTLKSENLDPKIIRGHFSFFGVFPYKYVYVMSKAKGEWTMVVPYKPIIHDIVEGRVDFDSADALQLYESSQVTDPTASTTTLKPTHSSIMTTICSTSTFFAGKEHEYDGMTGSNAHKRDNPNKFISEGSIEYFFKGKNPEHVGGCRVKDSRDLFWRDTSGNIVKVKPRDWILDNFVRVVEGYWSVPGFKLKLLLKDHNESSISSSLRAPVQNGDYLTVRFATKFIDREMYKSNTWGFNNFSTMTTDDTYRHEVGHAFGLDDEYGEGELGGNCDNSRYNDFSTETYRMCVMNAPDQRTIYHYLAASRYVTKQKECKKNDDCQSGQWCDAGIDLKKNTCEELKDDGESCDLVGGAHQCSGGKCKLGKCFTPNSVDMGDVCFDDKACKQGKCSGIDGADGVCVCKTKTDCDPDQWCDAGIDFKLNACKSLKADGEKCGNADQCTGGKCGMGACYTPNSKDMGDACYNDNACKKGKCSAVNGAKGTCVCKTNDDCDKGQWCDAGADFTLNTCKSLKADGEKCGNADQCTGGKCGMGACFTPNSKDMGETCFNDNACKKGKCNAVDGAKGKCVCKTNDDCDKGQWCDAGADFKDNACKALKSKGDACALVGGDHQCKSDKCSLGKCK